MHKISFQAVDTLFFRDGSPFNRQELQANIRTIFPPSPTTLIGAIRAAYARALGWQDNTPWNDDIQSKLGSGFQLPDKVSFNGPYLFHQEIPLFPAPAHLLGIPPDKPQSGVKPQELTLLSPHTTLLTDLGEIAVPAAPPEDTVQGRKSLTDDWWINASGLQQILSGETPNPNTLIHHSALWHVEQRVGNYRDPDTRTTGLMSLYAPQHIRFHQDVQLVMYAQGWPELEMLDQQLIPVGGETRCCEIQVESGDLSQWLPNSPQSRQRYTMIALTPVQLTSKPAPGLSLGNATLQSACHSRAVMLGGWDRNQPRKLLPHLRPGSVLFMQADTAQPLQAIKLHGDHTSWGFGHFITGIW